MVLSVIITTICIDSIVKAFIKMMSCVGKMSLILLMEDEAQICGMNHSILSWGTDRKHYLYVASGVGDSVLASPASSWEMK